MYIPYPTLYLKLRPPGRKTHALNHLICFVESTWNLKAIDVLSIKVKFSWLKYFNMSIFVIILSLLVFLREWNHLLSNYDTINNFSIISDLGHARFNFIGNDLGNNFIDDIAKGYWSKLLYLCSILFLKYQREKGCIEVLKDTSHTFVPIICYHYWNNSKVKPSNPRDFLESMSLMALPTYWKDILAIKMPFKDFDTSLRIFWVMFSMSVSL